MAVNGKRGLTRFSPMTPLRQVLAMTGDTRREAPSGRLVRCHGGFVNKLRIGIIDIVSKGPTRALYARIMNASLASIMPQVIGVWCQDEGHEVTFVCYTGFEDLITELPDNVDVVFIGAFTEAAYTAYALSNLF